MVNKENEMQEKMFYLRPNVIVEPLVERWFAWSHLISPSTAAMNISKRHLEIINSYINSPEIHSEAVRDPKLLGGPFMDLKGERVDEVKSLLYSTLQNQKDLIDLALAINQLEVLLKKNAKGFSMEPLYEDVPELLKGFVELVYDLNNNPSFRLFEPLLYNSKFYNLKSQSIALSITNNDERPFVLSTPRLDCESILHLNIPFNNSAIDELSKMKRKPQCLSYISKLLNVPERNTSLFKSFFTEEPFIPYEEYQGDKVRMRYFGHACILIETKKIAILVDPIISYYGYSYSLDHFSDYDLPEVIDCVLITHNHQDHIMLETLLSLRYKIKNVIVPATTSGALQDPSLKLMFNAIGFNNVIEIRDLETLEFENLKISGIPFLGEHSDLNIHSKICYRIETDLVSALFVSDSCNVESKIYEKVQEKFGNTDIIFLGMECEGAPLSWLYGPLMNEYPTREIDQSRTLSGSNFHKGKKLISIFDPKEVYVYAMGLEPWLKFISSKNYGEDDLPILESNKLVNYCKSIGIVSERLYGEKELLRGKRIKVDI